ncbi:MAG: FeoB-associated Cys-rich membrane protein [Clostridia bacterium]
MFDFIINNLPTIAVGVVVLGIVVLIIIKIFYDKKNGKSSCGGDCSHCSHCGK